MSVLNVYLALCTDEIDGRAYEFIEQNKEFVRKYFGHIESSKAKHEPLAAVEPAKGSQSHDLDEDIPLVESDDEDDEAEKAKERPALKRSLSKQKSLMNIIKPLKKSATFKDLMTSVGFSSTPNSAPSSSSVGNGRSSAPAAVTKDEEILVFKSPGSNHNEETVDFERLIFNSDDLAAGFNLYLFLKIVEKSAVLLKLNEKILASLSSCLSLLAEEYKRALQRKHWERAECGSAEEAANLRFVLAVGNDSYRVLSVHVLSQSEVKTVNMPPLEILHELFAEFISIMELSAKYVNILPASDNMH
jgi:hypothetical protein